jgi:hypothetical protein
MQWPKARVTRPRRHDTPPHAAAAELAGPAFPPAIAVTDPAMLLGEDEEDVEPAQLDRLPR